MNALLALLPQIVELVKKHGLSVIASLFILLGLSLFIDGETLFAFLSLFLGSLAVVGQFFLNYPKIPDSCPPESSDTPSDEQNQPTV